MNRQKTMRDVKESSGNLVGEINEVKRKYLSGIESKINNYYLRSVDAKDKKKEIINTISAEMEKLHQRTIEEQIKLLTDMYNKEDKLDELINLFDGKVGESLEQDEISKICKEGIERYEKGIPPGYKDQAKKEIINFNGLEFEAKYGDLIVWKQIIKHARDNKKSKVIFVTDDNKEDWWYVLGGKNIGARAELKNELLREAEADLILINSNTFLRRVNKDIKKDLVDESVWKPSDAYNYKFSPKELNQKEQDHTARNLKTAYLKNHPREPIVQDVYSEAHERGSLNLFHMYMEGELNTVKEYLLELLNKIDSLSTSDKMIAVEVKRFMFEWENLWIEYKRLDKYKSMSNFNEKRFIFLLRDLNEQIEELEQEIEIIDKNHF